MSIFSYVLQAMLALGLYTLALRSWDPETAELDLFSLFSSKEDEEEEGRFSAILSAVVLLGCLVLAATAGWITIVQNNRAAFLVFVVLTFLSSALFFSRISLKRLLGWVPLNRYIDLDWLARASLILPVAWGWFLWPSWITYTLIGWVTVHMLLLEITFTRVKYLFFGALALVLYDIWLVFGTPIATDIVLKSDFLPPMGIIIPNNLFGVGTSGVSLLGLGDLFLPGCVMITAAKYGLHRWTMMAYTIALIATFLLAESLGIFFPALLVLMPVILSALLLAAKIKKVKLK